ncbi:aspartyl-tRNA synthetase [Hydrogenoanaerobacterium saccharovorans]|uniref:Aspartate--tRNA ligase n=1 Tax=Hydrogenoanaerobacterium saccharovorans TaxID=474960 RepID=A0A1H8AHS8_9FIRM|nr:aspartate--tRNA ligase [Hydrogenoanaerobacterium saccharovorans]RPF47946.1 aspartyl-tRNA synthetase [Hydrogenoanaerobacterium saccharovorans]SEM70093.1 aspartyl-tRNA synthetase [Hydrogenoanaerobacterium saccharovorans]
MKRTGYCGLYREKDVGKTETVMGWVQTKRDMGGVVFIDLRDREGILQVVFDIANLTEEDFATAETLKNESVVAVSGLIRLRDEETLNPKLATGLVELKATQVQLLSEAHPLPFAIEDQTPVREELRLKYRFLDIRRPQMLRNLRFRHQVQKAVQDYLDGDGFLAVETPLLTKSTPEGARDYLVPSRVHESCFYALPQSPQIFKQLLMVGGVDKYYQVARCFRDEDLRADRQPEFTQVDMEMSFVEQEDILQHLERLFKHLFEQTLGICFDEPFLRITWQHAMDVYGTDKPDIRFGLPIVDVSDIASSCGFSVFRNVMEAGGAVRAINVKGGADFTRTVIEELTQKAVSYGAKGMAWIAVKPDGELYSILTKYLTAEEMDAILKAVDAKPGDFVLFCADQLDTVRRTLGALRIDIAELLGLRRKDDFKFLFVTDFPQFEYSHEAGRYVATHHPFTMPYPEDVQYLTDDPARVRAQAYDVVLNGVELGSGSMRIYQKEVQQKMFEALGFTAEQIEDSFGFMVNAFQYGTPPHGGFAFGLDRLVMLMLGEDSLRQVIAFPKAKDASCLMTNAPDEVDLAQLKVLGITTGEW